MNPREINRRVAIACGWTWDDDNLFWISPDKSFGIADSPNYYGDLNACHEMEEILTNEQANQYQETLAEITGGCDYLFHIPADQRCEAFLRTIGQWEETE